jgi:aspartyl-tRNA(Asn)/glutamyl-tRNA(Gln) amidotransferase subunit B
MEYEPVIGLEVHAQLQTQSKIFSTASAAFGGEANSHVTPVCLGLPGVLPVLNETVVEYALRMAIATNSAIPKRSVFARKNYFYPDLPKGYQISQYEEPLCENGYVDIDVESGHKRIGLTRIHLEEDAGKSIHSESFVNKNETLIDVNRCGVPLIEIVTEPDIRSAKEAAAFLTKLRQIVQYLGVCDGNMEEGSLRCDANISVRPVGQETFGTKTELKNMNSIRGVEKAIEYEIERQISLLQDGEAVVQQTLLWDADRSEAFPMRGKEDAHDYRYFPDPDLIPVEINEEWIDRIKAALPELPDVRAQRLLRDYEIPEYDAGVLTDSRQLADYFENTARKSGDPKNASNWIMGEVLRVLKEMQQGIEAFSVTPEALAELIRLINAGTINRKTGKTVFDEMVASGKSAYVIVKEKGLVQISDTGELETQVDEVLDANPDEVQKYLEGKQQVIGFLMGQVMRATKGQANPKIVNELLRKALEARKG